MMIRKTQKSVNAFPEYSHFEELNGKRQIKRASDNGESDSSRRGGMSVSGGELAHVRWSPIRQQIPTAMLWSMRLLTSCIT
jgi:hypothetical protein